MALGEARNTAGHAIDGRVDFVAAADAARRADRPDLLGRAAYGYGGENALWLDFGDPIGPSLLAEALAALPAENVVERAQCLTQSSMWRVLDPDPTIHVREAQEGLRLAEESGDVTARYRALDIVRQAALGVGDLDGLLDAARRLQALGEESGDLRCLSVGRYSELAGRFLGNDLDGVRPLLDELFAMDRRRLPLTHWWSRVAVASNLALLEGRWDDVVPPSPEETAAIGFTGATLEGNHRMRVEYDQGNHAAAVDVGRTLIAEHGPNLVAWPFPATIAWMAGDEDDASAQLATWRRDVFEHIPAAFRLNIMAWATPVAVDLGLTDIAVDLAEEFRPRRGQWASWSVEIVDRLVDHCLGALEILLGDTESGVAILRTAVADYRRAGTRARLTDALADLAVLAGDDEARTEALALADELDMKGVTARLTA